MSSRFELVAAMIRTSTFTLLFPPAGSNSLSWSTRSSLTWRESGMQPTSSRKIVPLLACSNRPARFCTALVKAPFMCPNSSDSSRVSGIAPQLILTIFWSLRGLLKWIALAISSFPVPVSPWISTVLFRPATESISSKILAMLRPAPMMLSKAYLFLSWLRKYWFSTRSVRSCKPFRTRMESSTSLNGLFK